MIMRGPQSIDVPAVDDGNGQVLRVNATETAGWLPGVYWYSLRATRGTDVKAMESGQITILPDLASAGDGYTATTHAQRTLAAIEAVIERRATNDQERYRINNRELWRTPLADLLKLRDVYRLEVQRELAAERGKNPFGRKIRVSLR